MKRKITARRGKNKKQTKGKISREKQQLMNVEDRPTLENHDPIVSMTAVDSVKVQRVKNDVTERKGNEEQVLSD